MFGPNWTNYFTTIFGDPHTIDQKREKQSDFKHVVAATTAVTSGGASGASPPFEICVPPFHVWPPGCCIHPIQHFKNVTPLLVFGPSFWFLAPPAAISWRRAWRQRLFWVNAPSTMSQQGQLNICVIFLWSFAQKLYLAQTCQIRLRQCLAICSTESIKNRKTKWFQTYSGGNACFELTHLLQSNNRVFYWQTNVLLTSHTSVAGLSTWILANKRLSLVATLKCTIQQKPKCMQRFLFSSLAKDSKVFLTHRRSTLPAREPRLVPVRWTANLATFSCRQWFMDLRRLSLSQIRKRTVSRWWTAWREATSCCFSWPCDFGHSKTFNFQEWKFQHRPVHLKTFGKAANRRLWRFSKFRGVEWQLEHISYTNRKSQALQWKLSSFRSQFRRHGGALVGLAPPNKAPSPQIETGNTINQCSFCQFLEYLAPRRNAKPLYWNFLATVLLLSQGKYWTERFPLLDKQLPNVEMTNDEGQLCFSSTTGLFTWRFKWAH